MERALDLLPEMMTDPEFKQAWDALEAEYSLASALIEARSRAGLSQAQVAARMGLSLPAVARIETGHNVSIKTLKRYASATGVPISLVIKPDSNP